MKLKTCLLATVLSLFCISTSYASGLTIHGVEIGVGKFHRFDNKTHPYSADNAWVPYVVPNDKMAETPFVVKNADNSYSIFFSNLEELLAKSAEISKQQGQQISVFNIHAHGLPGGTWFPPTKAVQESSECGDWNTAAQGDDQGNYDQYYSAVPKYEIMTIRSMSHSATVNGYSCVSGLPEWQQVTSSVPDFKASLATDVQIHFLSCVVGLNEAGDALLQGIAKVLFTSDKSKIYASTYFGLGDWSMVEGMGFWDYQSDDQLDRDNENYPKNRKDREMMQKGIVRQTQLDASSNAVSQLISNVSFMPVTAAPLIGISIPETQHALLQNAPAKVRVPGTPFYVYQR